MRRFLTALLILVTCLTVMADDTAFLGIQGPVMTISEWTITPEQAEACQGVNMYDFDAVIGVLADKEDEQVLAGIQNFAYLLTQDSAIFDENIKRDTGGNISQIKFSNMPGWYNVQWKDGRPVKLTLIESSLEGIISLDAYDHCFDFIEIDWQPVEYAPNKTVMVPKRMRMESNGFFTEIKTRDFSNYVFDTRGNWLKCTVVDQYYDRDASAGTITALMKESKFLYREVK